MKPRRKRQKSAEGLPSRHLQDRESWVNNLIEGKRPKQEVRKMLDKLQANFSELVMKHEAYTALIDDDHEFEEEEAWLGECQEKKF